MDIIKINGQDNVAVALSDIAKATVIETGDESITVSTDIKRGHKIAVTDIAAGGAVIKYGNRIGIATSDIRAGDHVHVHNLKTALSISGEYEYEPAVSDLPAAKKRTFMGYRRRDGSVGIRNEIWIIPVVGCVNQVARRIAEKCSDLVSETIDAVSCFTHPYGCSQMGDDHALTRKILAALVRHPNAGGVLVLSLGCENITPEQFKQELGEWDDERVRFLTVQESADEIEEGCALVKKLAEYAGSFSRTAIDASELVVGLKCGGSDGLSGITANPAIGRFSDNLISMGGSTILTEVPEMFGAESILFGRCTDKEVFDKAVKMVNDFKEYFTSHGQAVYENPSPGNKDGGITTLEDKSCGCVQKGGRAKIVDVLGYGDRIRKKGLSLLSGPGNDIVSTTDLTAAGAHMILFSTGRGTPLGAPVPTVKISSNTQLYDNKRGWIDFNAGVIADGISTIDKTGDDLTEYVLAVASGGRTRQEINGYRDIAIFKDGVTL